MFLEFFLSSPKAVHIFQQGSRKLKKQSVFRAIVVSSNYMLTFSQKRENRPCSFFKTRVRHLWRGILDKNLYQTVSCIISYHVVTYPANNQRLGGQICHTRYIVLLYRTCPYIVPYAAISSLVLPNCHQCAAIECKSSHKIVPCAAISYSMKLYFKRSAMLP